MNIIFFIITTVNCLYAKNLPVKEIFTEEVWRGEILVEGVVAVRKEGKLTIEPGTVILFKSIDIDDDGIGDSELYVEGTIIAKGSKDAPIVFTSESNDKIPSSWKYIMVNHAKYAYFEHVLFEGAFSGLQVHFTKAIVKNSIFRNNVDGFRFSTANIYVCNNKMTKNRHGIRYEERDSKGIIEFNSIQENEIGIFPVTKCGDKVNFRYNNIEKNGYNIKVGDEQKENLSFKNNYFGMIFESEIRKKIYDKHFDKNLPIVNIKPYSKKPFLESDVKCLEEF
ncbi:MAG: hypothetical protein N2202_01150 [Proteobacteria bacterium]|nr:hypothetical protein [Pseudomonadota bacterium]